MPLKERGHILVVGKFAAASLILSFFDRGSDFVFEVNRTRAFSRNGKDHFGGFVLLGFRQFTDLVDGKFE